MFMLLNNIIHALDKKIPERNCVTSQKVEAHDTLLFELRPAKSRTRASRLAFGSLEEKRPPLAIEKLPNCGWILLLLFCLPFLSSCEEETSETSLSFLNVLALDYQNVTGIKNERYALIESSHAKIVKSEETIQQHLQSVRKIDLDCTSRDTIEWLFDRAWNEVSQLQIHVIEPLLEAAEQLRQTRDDQPYRKGDLDGIPPAESWKKLAVKAQMYALLAQAHQAYYSLLIHRFSHWALQHDLEGDRKNLFLIQLGRSQEKMTSSGDAFLHLYQVLEESDLRYRDRKFLEALKWQVDARLLSRSFWPTRLSLGEEKYRQWHSLLKADKENYFFEVHQRLLDLETSLREALKDSTPQSWEVLSLRTRHVVALNNELNMLAEQISFAFPRPINTEGHRAFLIAFKAKLLSETYLKKGDAGYRSALEENLRQYDPRWYARNAEDFDSLEEKLNGYLEERAAEEGTAGEVMGEALLHLRLLGETLNREAEDSVAWYRFYRDLKINPFVHPQISQLNKDVISLWTSLGRGVEVE